MTLHRHCRGAVPLAALMGGMGAGPAFAAQTCEPGWSDRFPLVITNPVRCALEFDDGSGPALYVGEEGIGSSPGSPLPTSSVLRWTTDQRWADVGEPPLLDTPESMVVFDDGAGERLYVGGHLQRASVQESVGVMRLEGDAWAPILEAPPAASIWVSALCVYDDGAGAALYAAGYFQPGNGLPANRGVLRWDGREWLPVGGWFDNLPFSLCVYDDGSGPALIAGGYFTSAPGKTPANHIAKWNGHAWSPLGGGVGGGSPLPGVTALAVFDAGGVPSLAVGGYFHDAGGVEAHHVARWDGSSWSALALGFGNALLENRNVWSLAVFDDGSGPSLYAGGAFVKTWGSATPDLQHVARWDGQTWRPCGGGITDPLGVVLSLAPVNAFGRPVLCAGGNFLEAGGHPAPRFAAWDGRDWSRVGEGMIGGIGRLLHGTLIGKTGLYLGGWFSTAGHAEARRLATWDGNEFHEVGGGVNGLVHDLEFFDDGAGTVLAVAGSFDHAGAVPAKNIAGWDGAAWRTYGEGLGAGLGGATRVQAVVVHDDGSGPALHATLASNLPSPNPPPPGGVYRWDGAAWTLVGQATWFPSLSAAFYDMFSFDDGSGPALYVAGAFEKINGVTAKKLARLRNGSWESVGLASFGPTEGGPGAFFSYHDGTQDLLLVGGSFRSIGGVQARSMAAWDGRSWSEFRGGVTISGGFFSAGVNSFATIDDGRGPALFICGYFHAAGGVPANRIARWNGESWEPLGSGLGGGFGGFLAGFDDGSGPALFVGGDFWSAGGHNSLNFAKWQACPTCYPDCDGSGTLTFADFTCFQTKFAAAAPEADCNASGTLTVADFTCFQAAFVAGCP